MLGGLLESHHGLQSTLSKSIWEFHVLEVLLHPCKDLSLDMTWCLLNCHPPAFYCRMHKGYFCIAQQYVFSLNEAKLNGKAMNVITLQVIILGLQPHSSHFGSNALICAPMRALCPLGSHATMRSWQFIILVVLDPLPEAFISFFAWGSVDWEYSDSLHMVELVAQKK